MIKNTHVIWLSVGFTVVAFMSATVWLIATGTPFGVDAVIHLYIPEIMLWNVWILAAPVIFWAAGRFSFSTSPFSWKWVVHIPLAVLISATTYAVYLLLLSFHFWLSASVGLIEAVSVLEEIQRRIRVLAGIGVPFGAMFYGLLVVLFHVYNSNERLREEERRSTLLKAQLAEAKLQALKMQLHPHFLFNSLNTISATLQTDAVAADNMLAELGDFLRLTLEHADRVHVSLEEEIRFIRKYLQIEQHRFEDRLIVEYAIAPEVEQAAVPYLILQPLVENAIKHGVGHHLGTSQITISAFKEGEDICIVLYNTGAPIKDTPLQIQQGVGLSNTLGRLKELYGDKGGLLIQNVEEGGVRVRLQIPFELPQTPALLESR